MVEQHSFGSDGCMKILARFRGDHPDRFFCDARLGSFLDSPTGLREICSYPSESPSIKLDYILLFTRDSRVGLGSEELLSLCSSNHRPLAAELQWTD